MVGEALVYEPKWDGYRAIAHTGPVRIESRAERRLDSKWPEVAGALSRQIPPDTTLDGEIVRWSEEGRLDFEALQHRNRAGTSAARRMAGAEPCHYVVFDLLEVEGTDISRRSLRYRRQELEELMRFVEQPSPLTLGWQTDDPETARRWYEEMPVVGVEGLVVKDLRRAYRPGHRGWWKYKYRATTETIVGGVIGHAGSPQALILGRRHPQFGDLRIVGRTQDLTPDQEIELGDLLRKAGSDHPWPATLPTTWGAESRHGFTRVEPEVVVEIEPDAATSNGKWRHLVPLIRVRGDLSPDQVPHGLEIQE